MASGYISDTVWYSREFKDQGYTGDVGVHRRLFQHVRSLEQDQEEIHYQNLLNVQLYTNREMMSFDWNDANTAQYAPLDHNLENIIQSVLDTLVSRVGKNRPKATIVTRGADYGTYLRGRQLDRYLWGEFQHQDIHVKGESCFLDALIFGTGVMKIDIDEYDKEIFSERVCPDEIIVDQRECVSDCKPLQLHHRRLVSRIWLKETYGHLGEEVEMAIAQAQSKGFTYTTLRNPSEDQIVVIESWKLPTRKGADDGRHVICIENCTLLDEQYDRDNFPFVFFRWNMPKQGGFYGRSLVEDLIGYQIRQNELNDDIREGQDRMCKPRVFLDQGSGIIGSKLDSTIGRIVHFRGTPPIVETWTAFNPEIYNERDRNREAAFRFAGVSEFSAQNKLPSQARLDSSEALREYNAIEDERFNHQAQAYEKFYLDIAEHLLARSAELYTKYKKDRKNDWKSQFLAQQIAWSDVDLDRDRYVLQISASSIINMTPAARKDKLNEWAAAGVITQEQYKAWSGEPDLERMVDLMSAGHDYIQASIDKMLQGELVTPNPFANLNEGYKTVVDTMLHLEANTNCPEEILQLFRDWLELAKELIQPTQMQSMVPEAPPMGDPVMMGAAGAPPMDPAAMGAPGAPPMLPPGTPTNPMTNSAIPAVSGPAAQAFLGQ